jgi:hypothetical protein
VVGAGTLVGYIEREYIAAITDGTFESIFYPSGAIKLVFPYYVRKLSFGYLLELKPSLHINEDMNLGLSIKIVSYLDGDSILLVGVNANHKL